jgi:hypothetical protein
VTLSRPSAAASIAKPLLALGALAVVATMAAAPAHAQVTQAPKAEVAPDPSKFATGLYTGGEVGAVAMFGPVGPHRRPGFGLGLVVGYDFFRWLSIEARGLGSTHVTSFTDAPQDGEIIQLYHATLGLKVTIPIRQLAIAASGGAGLVHTSTNVLASAGFNEARTSLAAGGGLALDYHPLSRHFSFGVRAGYLYLFKIAASSEIVATACLRYVF